MLSISSRLSKLCLISGGIILVIVALGLYSFSGLPKPQRLSAEAVQRRNQLNLMVLARAVHEMEKESGSVPNTWDDLVAFCHKQNITLDFDQLRKEGPGESIFQPLSTKTDTGKIILQGQVQDTYGLVWALTDKGFVVKIDPGRTVSETRK